MRLFIAIDLSKDVEEELGRLQKEIKSDSVKASWSKSFHLTLKFLGDVNEEKVPQIVEKLRKVQFEKFRLKLNGLGVFPSKSYIKILWVGIENSNELNHLYKHIKNALSEFPDDHDFHPHLTLARVALLKDKKAFAEKLEKTKVEQLEFEAKSFILYKSTLTPEGPVYEKVGEFEKSF